MYQGPRRLLRPNNLPRLVIQYGGVGSISAQDSSDARIQTGSRMLSWSNRVNKLSSQARERSSRVVVSPCLQARQTNLRQMLAGRVADYPEYAAQLPTHLPRQKELA